MFYNITNNEKILKLYFFINSAINSSSTIN